MNIRHHTLLQHTMKFSTNGLNNEGATIIEYVTPSISEAEKLCLADIHENIEEDIKYENTGNKFISDTQLAADNANRTIACTDMIAKEYGEDGKVKENTSYYKLPPCPYSGIQLASTSDMWQGDEWNSKPKDLLSIKGRCEFAMFNDKMSDGTVVPVSLCQMIWEIPVGEQGKKTFNVTPTKTPRSHKDKLARALKGVIIGGTTTPPPTP